MALYAIIADIDDYHTLRGNTAWTGVAGVKTAAAWRAQTWLNSQRWVGVKTDRLQDNAWPRTDSYDADGAEIPDDEVPQAVIDAFCEAALIELVTPNALTPALERGGEVSSFTLVGVISETYKGSAPAGTVYTAVMNPIRGLLHSQQSVKIVLA